MRAQIERAMRRPWRYWYEDGLAEMATGLVFFVLGTLVSLGGLGSLPGGAAYFAGLGLAALLSGAVTLRGYLRATQPLSEGEGHGR